jgi:hypothetical protein
MFVTAISIASADKTRAGNRWENPWNFAQNRLSVSAAASFLLLSAAWLDEARRRAWHAELRG